MNFDQNGVYPSSSAGPYPGNGVLGNGTAPIPSRGNRSDKSLFVTVQKFMQLEPLVHHQYLDLGDAALILGVPLRRLYDITNILEGLDVIEKNKKRIRWKDRVSPEAGELRTQLAALKKKEEDIDLLIKDMQSYYTIMTEDPANARYAYLKCCDVQRLDPEKCRTTFAIKTPFQHDTEIVISENPEGPYKMLAKNRLGTPLMVMICSEDIENGLQVEMDGKPHPESPSIPIEVARDQPTYEMIEDGLVDLYNNEVKQEL